MRALALLLAMAAPAQAQDSYVENNALAIFYHEFGHALIDVLELPIFGREEDAADILSVVIIDLLYGEDDAREIIGDAATAFAVDAEEVGPDIAWWGVHSPDLTRYWTTLCLFAGADLETRSDFAEEWRIPAPRLDTCEEEYALAAGSWGQVLDDLAEARRRGGAGLSMRGMGEDPPARAIAALLAAEIRELNEVFALPEEVSVEVLRCGEPNAFYDPESRAIVFCAEFATWLAETAPS